MQQADEVMTGTADRYRAFVELSPDTVHIVDLDGTIIMANQRAAELHRYASAEAMQKLNAVELLVPGDRIRAVENFKQRESSLERVQHREYTGLRADGTHVPVEIGTSVLLGADGTPEAYLVVLRDVTERRQAEEALRESEERHRQMFARNRAIKLLLDPATGKIVDANPAACAFYGYSLPDLKTRTIMDLNMTSETVYEAEGQAVASGELCYMYRQHRLASGEIRDVEVYVCPIDVRGKTLFFSIIHDVTERKRTEQALEHQALHDALTGLPNRALLRDRLQHAIMAAEQHAERVALFFLDLDRFKEVNDTLGHHAGDLLLQDLAVRLVETLRETDTIARLGGDEFAILLPNTDEHGALHSAEKVTAALERPFELESNLFHLGVSIGIALYPEHAATVATLMSRADVAMYVAKRTDANHVVYAPEHDVDSPARLALLRTLRDAIENNRLVLHYQPQLELTTGCPEHVEALVRWQDGDELIPPDVFIGLAEETGLIKPLTTWVLHEAMRQSGAWQAAGHDVSVAVNLSARTLHDPQLVETVAHALRVSGVKPSSLELEITETAIIVDPQGALDTLSRLHAMGIHIAIDDFGTGYTSLGHLRRLPIDDIKIDRSFVVDMKHNVDNAFIVRSIVDLARNLGLGVVAEGVEDRETLDTLRDIGCNMAQGYYLSRPLPAEAFQTWLKAQGHVHNDPALPRPRAIRREA